MKTIQKALMVLFISSMLPFLVSAQTFKSNLRQGFSGDDVKVLQALLAADPDIYPEALISGYYGSLTKKAVMRFQKKHNLEPVGYIGPMTLKKLNELLSQAPVEIRQLQVLATSSAGTLTATKINVVCAKVPPGHLIAPGWLKKNNNLAQIVPECQTLPPGIVKQFTGSTTTPPVTQDTTAPIISSITVSSVGKYFATISWMTNEFSTTKVYIGTSSPVTTASSTLTQVNGLSLSHRVFLTSLEPRTTYYVIAVSSDSSGNVATSSQMSFTTAINILEDKTPPLIFSLNTSVTATSSNISWVTNENSTTKVYYGTTTPVTPTNSMVIQVEGFDFLHNVMLSGLLPATNYYLLAVSSDTSGNTATSSQTSFVTTSVVYDNTPPSIYDLFSYTSPNTATIVWKTNEPSTSKLYYGTSSPLVPVSSLALTTDFLTTLHIVTASGLTPSTTYYYLLEVKDVVNNIATSTLQSFITKN
jgi:peptidoglycan hydrolase-like protein with peptidoglycan-binding domain